MSFTFTVETPAPTQQPCAHNIADDRNAHGVATVATDDRNAHAVADVYPFLCSYERPRPKIRHRISGIPYAVTSCSHVPLDDDRRGRDILSNPCLSNALGMR